MGKNTSVMDAAWPSNVDISKLILIINNTLNYNRIPTFTIIVIGVVIGWSCDGYVRSIDCTYTLWKSPCFLEPCTTLLRCSLAGNLMYLFIRTFTIAAQVSCTMLQTVHLAMPNRCPIVRYSTEVARHQMVIATRCWTGIALRILVLCRLITGVNC